MTQRHRRDGQQQLPARIPQQTGQPFDTQQRQCLQGNAHCRQAHQQRHQARRDLLHQQRRQAGLFDGRQDDELQHPDAADPEGLGQLPADSGGP